VQKPKVGWLYRLCMTRAPDVPHCPLMTAAARGAASSVPSHAHARPQGPPWPQAHPAGVQHSHGCSPPPRASSHAGAARHSRAAPSWHTPSGTVHSCMPHLDARGVCEGDPDVLRVRPKQPRPLLGFLLHALIVHPPKALCLREGGVRAWACAQLGSAGCGTGRACQHLWLPVGVEAAPVMLPARSLHGFEGVPRPTPLLWTHTQPTPGCTPGRGCTCTSCPSHRRSTPHSLW